MVIDNKFYLHTLYHDKEDNFFKVVPCQINDIHEVEKINKETLPENYPYFFYKSILDSFSNSFLVAMLKGETNKIIGYIMWRIEKGISNFGLKVVSKGHLVSIAVDKKFQGRGVGTILLAKSLLQVKKFNVQEFVLEVRLSNFKAINLYQNKLHFEKQKILKNYYKDGENAYLMALQADLIEE